MIRIEWLIALADQTWVLYTKDYNEHELEDFSEVCVAVGQEFQAKNPNVQVALVAEYFRQDLEEE